MADFDELEFKISSGLKNIIGKDLITDDFIAVFELVKNSYDAHSSRVNITFEEDRILLSDDGKGMSLEDIKNKWLFVAYSAKQDGEEDIEFTSSLNNDYRNKISNRKYYAGAKGIGRFSSDRLGRKLKLITKKIGHDQIEVLKVDWSKFEVEATEEFEDIKIQHDTLNNYPQLKSESGTILEITELNSSWSRSKLQQLKYSLEKLINPFSYLDKKPTDDFSISMTCIKEEKDDLKEKFPRGKVNGPIKNFIFETLDVKTTQIQTTITPSWIETVLIDRGTPIYHIKEPNKKYELLVDCHYQLFFLNTAAKSNFTRQMGLQPVGFGSVFLFKNGFRVYPFGDPGDDSLGMDHRKQQGYARFLGTRDLLGRIELFTNDTEEFKEVTSRDGGLVETTGYLQLVDSFYEKCLKRLERYVVDVQWAYKVDEELRNDREKEDISVISHSLGGRSLIADILRKLSDNKDIEIVSYNKDLINILNEKLDSVPPEVFRDLAKIAEKTGDENFKEEIHNAEQRYLKLLKEKEEAERRAQIEEHRRQEAEEAARIAEEKRKIEEEKRIKAEEAQKIAELKAKEKELQRREEEVKRKEAEQKAKEAEEKRRLEEIARKEAEEKRRLEEIARKEAEAEVHLRKNQVNFLTSVKAIEYDDVRDLNHIIGINSDNIKKRLLIFKRAIDKGKNISNHDLLDFIKSISLANDKISAITKFTTKGNFLKASTDTKEDIVSFIRTYFDKIYQYLYEDLTVEFINSNIKFVTHFKPIEITVVFDNLISNSRKKKASKIEIEFSIIDQQLIIVFRDFGKPLDPSITDKNIIFEEGITTTNGSGLGLAHVKKIISDLKGSIEINTEFTKGFELTLTLPRCD